MSLSESAAAQAQAHIERATDAFAARDDATYEGWHFDVASHRPHHPRGGRTILRANDPSGGRTVIVKVYDAPNAAQMRFASLKGLRDLTDKVVTPLFLSAKHNLFVMEDAGTRTLLDELTADAGTHVTRQAMDWLVALTAQTPQVTKPFDTGRPLADTAKHCAHLPPELAEKSAHALDILRGQFEPFERAELRHFTIFGDLKPENLCIHPQTGALIGIDYVTDAMQPLERDAAFFLQWMRQRNWTRALRNSRWIEPADEIENEAAALQTLGKRLNVDLLHAYQALFLTQMWTRLASSARNPALLEAVEARLGL